VLVVHPAGEFHPQPQIWGMRPTPQRKGQRASLRGRSSAARGPVGIGPAGKPGALSVVENTNGARPPRRRRHVMGAESGSRGSCSPATQAGRQADANGVKEFAQELHEHLQGPRRLHAIRASHAMLVR